MNKIILVANTDWYLYNFRLSLAEALRQEGYEVVLASPPGPFTSQFAERGFRWLEWQVGRQTLAPWKELPALQELARIYRQEQPVLVHHHTIKPVLYGSLVVARLAASPAVVNSITGRGYVFEGKAARANLLRVLVKSLYRLALNRANSAAIFENEADRQYFIQHKFIPPERTWLIAGVGVDPELFQPTPEPPGPPVVMLSSRMLWDKGVGVLVEAARLLQSAEPDRSAKFVLVGVPDPGNPASIAEEQLQEWVDEGIVEWWGWQSDMPQVYPRCHIFALPTSYGEGVPTVLLEAAACGRVLVASDIPGCREIVQPGQNGLLVPPNDPGALADALFTLISDPDLRGRMGSAARQLVVERFTTAQVNAATLAVYRSILQPSEGGTVVPDRP